MRMNREGYKETFNHTSNFINLIGARLTVLEEDCAEVELVTNQVHMNVNNTVHGGVLFSLADTAVGAASKSHGRASVTLEGKLNFLRPVSGTGKVLKAVAHPYHTGKRTGVFECKIFDEKGCLVAAALYTMYMLGDLAEK